MNSNKAKMILFILTIVAVVVVGLHLRQQVSEYVEVTEQTDQLHSRIYDSPNDFLITIDNTDHLEVLNIQSLSAVSCAPFYSHVGEVVESEQDPNSTCQNKVYTLSIENIQWTLINSSNVETESEIQLKITARRALKYERTEPTQNQIDAFVVLAFNSLCLGLVLDIIFLFLVLGVFMLYLDSNKRV